MNDRSGFTFSVPMPMRITQQTPCSYIKGMMEQRLIADISFYPDRHDILARAGFRRVENWVYRPVCSHCRACQPIRIVSGNGEGGGFTPSRSQRRILAKNRGLERRLVANIASAEHYALFQSYLNSRHHDGQMVDMSMSSFSSMIGSSPIETALIEYHHEQRLVGVMLIDLQQDGLSLVYSFFDPVQHSRSLGSFMILDSIALAFEMGLPYVYLGYYVASSSKMNYKQRFRPAEILQDGVWVELQASSSDHSSAG